jgi:OPT family oligopeptide transporter
MRPIPVSPGILDPQHPNPAISPISYAYTPAREPVQIVLPATANSNDSSVLSPAQLKRVSSDPNTSALDLASQTVTMSYKLTDMGPAEDEEDSPYAEVRASVSNMDDPEMPTMTFRMWFLGLILVFVGATVNTFFNFRYPAPWLMPSLILLIAYPLGKAFALFLPIRTWVLPRILGGGKFTLNPGPFNVKEHVLIYMMANVGAVPAYVMNAIVVADKYYGLSFGPGFEICLILATTLTGFGLAGLCRELLVKPASMVWPQNLVSCTLLNTLHAEDDDRSTGISRYQFFIYVTIGTFLWTFFPSFLFLGLSFFSWACWIAPSAYLFSLSKATT